MEWMTPTNNCGSDYKSTFQWGNASQDFEPYAQNRGCTHDDLPHTLLSRKHRKKSHYRFNGFSFFWIIATLGLLLDLTGAVYINFENCLSPNKIHSEPRQLQFVPLLYWAHFNSTDSSHNLSTTVYGNVTGQLTAGPYPPPNDPQWHDPKETFGKIVDVDEEANKLTTLFAKLNLLSYTPWNNGGSEFCKATVNAKCPIGPAFWVAPCV